MGVVALSQHGSAPDPADYFSCVHCGLCLEHCPTYLQTGLEISSPRGRIHLITALNEGRIEPSEVYAESIEQCLVCRACEAACPSGVAFGRIMESARAQLREREPTRGGRRILEWLVFDQLIGYPDRLLRLGKLLRAYQRSGLSDLLQRSGVLQAVAPRLAALDHMLPDLPKRFFHPRRDFFPAPGKARARVALFTGCVMPLLYPNVHWATIRVLNRNGCDVYVPHEQVCCGALNVHSGEREAASRMAASNIHAFEYLPIDALVVNAAGCGSTLKEYGELIRSGDRLAEKVRDIHEFLMELGLRAPRGRLHRTVTLQESCHLIHAQRVSRQPRAILEAIPGLSLVDMPHPDRCCGSAGSYSVTHTEMSMRLLDERMAEAQATGADTIATANPGCLLQLTTGVRRHALQMEVKHVIELLDESYGRESRWT
ncbi:MAG TPA: (Fe-S)-binding protein [Chloroflexota bacterium]|nr:(Fe-S)-binding protein [Chloroflexota bacterium]